MPNTTNNSLPYPSASDTVDVPRDIQALADALDTKSLRISASTSSPSAPVEGMLWYQTDTDRLVTYTGAQWPAVGMQLITDCTVTSAGGTAATASNGVITIGTGNTSVTITAFSSRYQNYRVVIAGNANSSANDSMTMQLRTGTTTSTTGYYGALHYIVYATQAAVTLGYANAANFQQVAGSIGSAGTSGHHGIIEIMRPFEAARTTFQTTLIRGNIAGPSSGYHDVATSYDQLVLAPAGGTITGGTIRIYGYVT